MCFEKLNTIHTHYMRYDLKNEGFFFKPKSTHTFCIIKSVERTINNAKLYIICVYALLCGYSIQSYIHIKFLCA